MVRLGDLIEQIRGVSYKPEDVYNQLNENSIALLRANNIKDGQLNFDDVIYVSRKKVHDNQLLKAGDILICTSSGSKELVGKAAYVQEDLPITFGAFCKVVRPQKIRSDYLGHFFNSPNYRQKISDSSAGANINNIRNEHIDELEVLLPTVDRQEYVVVVLDKLTSLTSLRKQQLAKLDELVKARFVEMFGGPVQNPLEWPIHQLQDYILFLTSGSRGWAQYFTDDGKYFITIKNVKNCCITLDDVQYVIPPDNAEAKRTKVEEGDLLISITADLGRTGVVTKEIADYGAYINQHLTCIRLDRNILHPLYVAYYMESEAGKIQFQLKNQNGVKAGLNFDAINSLNLMVPPLERQNNFVDFAAKVSQQKLTIQQSLDKLEVLKKALMQEYFG